MQHDVNAMRSAVLELPLPIGTKQEASLLEYLSRKHVKICKNHEKSADSHVSKLPTGSRSQACPQMSLRAKTAL